MSDSVRKFEKKKVPISLCMSPCVCVSEGKGKDKKGNV